MSKYTDKFNKHGESPKALLWKGYASAAQRYRVLLNDINLESKTVLDVGCGMGDLLPYIYAVSNNFLYLGVDMHREFIDVAKKRYEGHAFEVLDPFKQGLKKHDVVIVCGALNSNEENWLQNRKDKIAKLFDLANEVLVFNMAGSFNDAKVTKNIAYANINEIMEFCTSLTSKIILKTNYHSKDFTIVMFK